MRLDEGGVHGARGLDAQQRGEALGRDLDVEAARVVQLGHDAHVRDRRRVADAEGPVRARDEPLERAERALDRRARDRAARALLDAARGRDGRVDRLDVREVLQRLRARVDELGDLASVSQET